MSNTTDLGIPVTIVFSLCVSRKTVNNLTLDLAFFLLFLKSGRGEREENSSREKHKIVKIVKKNKIKVLSHKSAK